MSRPYTPTHKQFITQEAAYPDAETAHQLGGIYKPPRTRPPVENRHWKRAEDDGRSVFAFMLGHPELRAELDACCVRLAARRVFRQSSARIPIAAQARNDVGNRRRFFVGLAFDALYLYRQQFADPATAISEKAAYVQTAFKRLCVLHYFATQGQPNYPYA